MRPALGPGAHDVGDIDRAIARLATRQSGVVGRDQVRALGLGPEAIKHRVRTGRLIVIHRGVYAVGHEALSDRGRVIAGLLAAGPRAVASHRTAAALWKLIPTMPAQIEVTTTGRARRSRPTLRIHETTTEPETTSLHDLPLTAPLRTLQDLARTRPNTETERATTEALVLQLVTPTAVNEARLTDTTPAPTRSELERTMLAIVNRAGLPRPKVNHPLGPYVIDFLWPEQRVVVETDGFAAHGHRLAFERDRARDAALQAAGYAVLRFTWRQLTQDPLLVTAQLARVLARAERRAA